MIGVYPTASAPVISVVISFGNGEVLTKEYQVQGQLSDIAQNETSSQDGDKRICKIYFLTLTDLQCLEGKRN